MTDQLATAGAEAIAVEQLAPDAQIEAVETTTDVTTTAKPADEVAIPKKILNAMSHKDRRIGKLTARQHEAEATIKQLQEQLAKMNPSEGQKTGAPSQEQFSDYGEFLRADAAYQIEQKFLDRDKQAQSKQSEIANKTYISERMAHIEENDSEARGVFSDFDSVFKESEYILEEAPEHIKLAFLDAENPAFAFYSLAKEGKLEQLMGLSERQAIAMITRYEDKALAQSKAKQVTRAPAPITSSRGNGVSGSKNYAKMDAKDVLDDIMRG